LLDFLDSITSDFGLRTSDFIVIETGGMKGRKEEMTKDELLKIYKKVSELIKFIRNIL
jgi:predicted GTPase